MKKKETAIDTTPVYYVGNGINILYQQAVSQIYNAPRPDTLEKVSGE